MTGLIRKCILRKSSVTIFEIRVIIYEKLNSLIFYWTESKSKEVAKHIGKHGVGFKY